MAARRRVAAQPNQNRITDGKGLGSNMEYEIAKASGQHRNSSSGTSKFADFLGVIQSNDEMLQLKRNDLDELKKVASMSNALLCVANHKASPSCSHTTVPPPILTISPHLSPTR